MRPGGATLTYTYDAEGNRTAVTAPSGTTSYAHDALGRVTAITDPAGGTTSFAYDGVGNPTSRTQPNGVTTTYTRDLRDRLTTIESRTATNALLARYAYTLDLAGNRTEVLEHTGRRVSWQYDALSRLTSETTEDPGEPPVSEGFGYDAVGNRVLHATSAGVFTPSYDANDGLLSDGTATYAWDANGNLASRTDASGTTSFAFDARDRLVEVDGPATGLVEHVYDHAGDRVETRVNGAITRYLVDANRGLSQVVEERDGLGGLVAAYVHGDAGEPLARLSGPDPAYFLHDGQGSVRQLADGTAAITDTYAYSAFGETLAASGATPNPYRYGGQWEEPSSGLYHLRARWMDPRVGRFLSTDPFAGFDRSPESLHRYLYANANPLNFVDPSGLFSLREVSATTAIIGYLASTALNYSVGKTISVIHLGVSEGNLHNFKWFEASDLIATIPGAVLLNVVRLPVQMVVRTGGVVLGKAFLAGGVPRVVNGFARWFAKTGGKLPLRTADGAIVELERGTSSAGFEHIVQRHLVAFWDGTKASKTTFWPSNVGPGRMLELLKEAAGKVTAGATREHTVQLSNGIVAKLIIAEGKIITFYPIAGPGVVSASALVKAVP